MNTLFKALAVAAAASLAATSCTTTYDYYGRPVQSVDPGVALAGVAAAGLVGYAVADGRRDRVHHHTHVSTRHYYGGGYYGGGYGGDYCPPPYY